MRVGYRIDRGLWVVGGGGVLLFAVVTGLLRGLTIAVLAAAASTIALIAVVGVRLLLASRSARRALALDALKGAVEDDSDETLQEVPTVWAVYAVGDEFHHGVHPKKGEALACLFPGQTGSIARVAAFPDSRRAAKAASLLRRRRFSFRELVDLFPHHYRAPRRSESSAAQTHVQPNTAAARSGETMMHADGKEGRDLTRYSFDGQSLGKGRLVLAIVRRYVMDHPRANLEAVRAVFPDSLQARSPIQFSRARSVVAKLDSLSPEFSRRYFVDEADRIALADGVVVVSREWNRFNIQNVLEVARQLGYVIK